MYGLIKQNMKKILFLTVFLLTATLSVFSEGKEKEKNRENKSEKTEKVNDVKPSTDNKLKADMEKSVLEFMRDMKVSSDSTYIPLKKQ
jgi:hypothetical protein